MKKITAQLLISILLLLSFAPANVNATSTTQKAKAAYREMLEENNSITQFTLLDINEDKIPELITRDEYGISIVTFLKGEVKSMLSYGNSVYWNKDLKMLTSYSKNGKNRLYYTYKYKKGSSDITIVTDYGYLSGNYYWLKTKDIDPNSAIDPVQFKVSKSTVNKLITKYTKTAVLIKTDIKNTKANRTNYLD